MGNLLLFVRFTQTYSGDSCCAVELYTFFNSVDQCVVTMLHQGKGLIFRAD